MNNISPNSLYKPKSYKEAINSPQKELWIKAINIELNTLKNNNIWELVKKSANIKSIKTRWVYKIKYNNSQAIFKARFVAKGFEQIYNLDYIETFVSVVKQLA